MVLAVTQEGHMLWMECDMYPSFSPGPRNRFQRRSDVHVKASWHYPEMLIKPHLVYGHLSSVPQDDQYAWFRNWQTIWGPYSSKNKSEFCSSVAAWTVSGGLVTAHLFSDLMAHLLEALQMQLAWRGPTRPILGNSATFWYWHRAQSGNGFESTLDGDLLRQYLRLTDVEKRALIANDFDTMPVSFSAQTSQLAAPTMPSLTEKAIDTYNELYLGPLHLRELFEAQNRPWPVETRDSHLLAFQTDVKDTEWTLQFLDHIMRGIELFC
ncbi:hypothetical protein BC940DRAFT_102714 [Gongronella butleri]|nr:hypothetical protein BC940DRAFT_102714 [Gongronella butleri]